MTSSAPSCCGGRRTSRDLAGGAAATARQRPLDRELPARADRPLPLRGRGVARRLRQLPRRAGEEARGRRADRRWSWRRAACWSPLPASAPADAAAELPRGAIAAAEEAERLALLLSPQTATLMAAADDRALSRPQPGDAASRPSAPAPASPAGTSCFRARQPDDPARHGTFDDVIARLPDDPRHGLRRALFPADPPDRPRPTARAATTALVAGAGRSRQPLCDRLRGGRARRDPSASSARSRTSAGWSRRRREHGLEIALDFAIQCSPDHPWIKRASGLVRLAAGRHDQVRREPAEEVRGHRQRRLLRATAMPGAVARAARRRAVLGRRRACSIFRVDNPHTKPLPFWEWMIARGHARASRRDLPGRGVHPAEGDEAAGQGRLHAVLHLLHLAQHQAGARPSI